MSNWFQFLYCSPKFGGLGREDILQVSKTNKSACRRFGCFCRGKIPENAELAIGGAILDARVNQSGARDKARGRTIEKKGRRGGGVVTRPRPIFARVQDGAGDGELRVFWGLSAIKTPPSNRLQAG